MEDEHLQHPNSVSVNSTETPWKLQREDYIQKLLKQRNFQRWRKLVKESVDRPKQLKEGSVSGHDRQVSLWGAMSKPMALKKHASTWMEQVRVEQKLKCIKGHPADIEGVSIS